MDQTCSQCGGARHAGAPMSGCFIALRTLVADQMRAWQERVGRLEERGGFTEIGEAVLRQTRTFSRLLNWLGIEFPGDPQEHRLPNLLKEGYIDRQYRAMAKLEVDAAERERFRDGVEAGLMGRIARLEGAAPKPPKPRGWPLHVCDHGVTIAVLDGRAVRIVGHCGVCQMLEARESQPSDTA